MCLGYVGNENQMDCEWVKHGMIFPFTDYVDRFQGQSELSYYNPSDFQMAIEEKFLADQGFTEKLIAGINAAAGNTGYDDTILKFFQEITSSNHYARHHFLNKSLALQDGCQKISLERIAPMLESTADSHVLAGSQLGLTLVDRACSLREPNTYDHGVDLV